MARPTGPKTRCNGQWTEAKYVNFIKNLLRGGTKRWAPKQTVKKKANVSRGMYLCAGCEQAVPCTFVNPVKRKRVNNIFVDHIIPVIPPEEGFTTWDSFIENLFCEEDNLQVLCSACHDQKSQEEREIATKRRREEKE